MAASETVYVEQLTIDGPPVQMPVLAARESDAAQAEGGDQAVAEVPDGPAVAVQESLDGTGSRRLVRLADGRLRWA